MAVALYARISEDQAGQGLGVARQETDCRELAARRGWDVAYAAIDNDVSAYKRKPRPQFERVLKDLQAGLIDGLVVYDCDRLARRPVDLERLIDLYDTHKLKFATVTTEIDLSTPDGRFIARLMVNFASKSSADTGRRIARKHLELAQKGVPVGGHRPFGVKADKRTIEPTEAALIQQAAKDILAGVPLSTIARQWQSAGHKTTAGNSWKYGVMKLMLLSPRMVGYRVYQKGIARDKDGNPVMATPPILDLETWEAVKAMLTVPKAINVHVGGRKYLLTGLVRCTVCSTPMFGNAHNKYDTFSYACRPAISTTGGCGRVACSGPGLDALITELVQRHLADREVIAESGEWQGEQEMTDKSQRIVELMAEYREGRLSGEIVFPSVAALEQEVAALKRERSEWLRAQVQAVPTDVVQAWPDLDTDQRRAIIESVIQAILIRPATRLGNRFDPERAEVVWR